MDRREKFQDVGLAVLLAIRRPGQTCEQAEIAAACDVTPQQISLIELRALRKLATRIKRRFTEEELAELMSW